MSLQRTRGIRKSNTEDVRGDEWNTHIYTATGRDGDVGWSGGIYAVVAGSVGEEEEEGRLDWERRREVSCGGDGAATLAARGFALRVLRTRTSRIPSGLSGLAIVARPFPGVSASDCASPRVYFFSLVLYIFLWRFHKQVGDGAEHDHGRRFMAPARPRRRQEPAGGEDAATRRRTRRRFSAGSWRSC